MPGMDQYTGTGSPGPGGAGADATPARDELRVMMRELAAQLLCVPPGEVPLDGELTKMGLDSVLAVEFALRVSDATGTELTVKELQRNPTVDLLADFLGPEGTRR